MHRRAARKRAAAKVSHSVRGEMRAGNQHIVLCAQYSCVVVSRPYAASLYLIIVISAAPINSARRGEEESRRRNKNRKLSIASASGI